MKTMEQKSILILLLLAWMLPANGQTSPKTTIEEFNLAQISKGKITYVDQNAPLDEITLCVKKGKVRRAKVRNTQTGQRQKVNFLKLGTEAGPICYSNQRILCFPTYWDSIHCICGAYVWRGR